jgi:hypothetical protein
MPTCPDFASAFQKNMAALGLPAPSSPFGTVQTATANLAAMLNAFKSVGTGATMGEIIGATTGLEVLSVVGGITASFYIGAVIGSLIVAADTAMVCTDASSAIWNIHRWATQNGIAIPASMYTFFRRYPEVVIDRPGRVVYALRATRAARAAA